MRRHNKLSEAVDPEKGEFVFMPNSSLKDRAELLQKSFFFIRGCVSSLTFCLGERAGRVCFAYLLFTSGWSEFNHKNILPAFALGFD